jgi:hypothetical protein
MSEEAPENTVLEILRKIQGELADLKAGQRNILLELAYTGFSCKK